VATIARMSQGEIPPAVSAPSSNQTSRREPILDRSGARVAQSVGAR
jgi:hypothetical protein